MFETDAIALGAPTAGRMSKRARKAALERMRHQLFDGVEWVHVEQPSHKETLLRQAKELRDLADRGMHPRKYRAEAARLEAKAKNA